MPEELRPILRFPGFQASWTAKSLGNPEVVTFLKGKGISKNDIVENGQTPCIRYGELYTEYNEVIDEIKSSTDVPEEELILSEEFDVIIPASGETVIDIATASCVLRANVGLGGDLNIIRPNVLNGVFLAYYLNSAKKKNIARLAQGISVIHLYKSHLKALNLNIPELDEQLKIANFLRALDKRIKLLKEKKEALEDYKKSIMQKVFAQEVRFKKDNGSDFPKWKEVKVSVVAHIVSGGTPSTTNSDLWNGDVNWFTPTEINKRYSSKSERRITELGLASSSATLIPVNSILFTSRATVGEVSITTEVCSTNQGFQSFVIKENNDLHFVYYWIKMNKNKFLRVATGTTFIEVSKKEIEKLLILKPHYNEQKKIGSMLKRIDDKIDVISYAHDNLNSFKQSLLQKMFV